MSFPSYLSCLEEINAWGIRGRGGEHHSLGEENNLRVPTDPSSEHTVKPEISHMTQRDLAEERDFTTASCCIAGLLKVQFKFPCWYDEQRLCYA